MNELGIFKPLFKFIGDLFEIDTEILRNEVIIFSDYKIEWNPEFSSKKIM
jgi:hypothetical protein